ncbi:MAG: hypothetical protein PUD74_00120 [Bacteroidales bacterium]|nr:hypothetical protein [Candidatus Cryptobacteroides sp.]MCI6526269.1 hypothetical protein [Bacteroidales bacterium]MCI6759121.1 hypothetical protein [Bacteroides sp.]MDD5915578.1 hypothetical protein [Bacteroidales bacterium]MDD6828188.1 hypothetical protein [Bacteroidales bacterium]MDD7136175.1 hypothetical protein [Bacteroidales bacterium]
MKKKLVLASISLIVILAFDSFALNLVHERNNEEPEEDNGIFKLVTLAR